MLYLNGSKEQLIFFIWVVCFGEIYNAISRPIFWELNFPYWMLKDKSCMIDWFTEVLIYLLIYSWMKLYM